MTIERFKMLCRQGETSQLEYKTCTDKISESLYETVCSFLNHNGGQILVGVSDSGQIVGVNPDRAESLVSDIITSIKNPELFLPCPYFTPDILEVDGKKVMVLDIPCGQSVYRYKGRFWDRNGEADIDITEQNELLLSLFERKNPHLFEERTVDGLTMEHLDENTFRYCRNILAVVKPTHPWLQLTDQEILLRTRLARKGKDGLGLEIKYAALILFGKEEYIEEFMPRYRFEALYHMCSYDEYNDNTKYPSRYDDRVTMRCNLIRIYDRLTQFVERYLPDKFYLPEGGLQREDLRWNVFREVVANICVHADYSLGYACFFHVFRDRVVTKNPTRLLPEIPEGEIALTQLNNYTKNPLLVRVFHELNWVEDMGSGTRNIQRYAPLYFPGYEVEINSGTQFVFSITYMEMSQDNGTINVKMSPENVSGNVKMSPESVKMSPESVAGSVKMSPETLSDEDLRVGLGEDDSGKRKVEKKYRRRQGIFAIIRSDPSVSIEEIAEKLDVNERTIHRDMEELKGVIEHVGPTKGGRWVIKERK